MAGQRKLTGYVNPVDVLKRIGVDGTTVTKVVITHLHCRPGTGSGPRVSQGLLPRRAA